jgi:hypothetical protein
LRRHLRERAALNGPNPPLARNGIVDFRVEIVALRNVRASNWINPFLAAIKNTGVKRVGGDGAVCGRFQSSTLKTVESACFCRGVASFYRLAIPAIGALNSAKQL